MKNISILALVFLVSCATQSDPPHGVAYPAVKQDAPSPEPPWLTALKKDTADRIAQNKFAGAYIECQEYDFKLNGCDVLIKKRDTDARAELVSQKQRQEEARNNAQASVSEEVKELEK